MGPGAASRYLADHGCGVAQSGYSAKVGKRWMISAVTVMRPGCKADSVMILEGGQGEGKVHGFEHLGGDWFMDTPFAPGAMVFRRYAR